MKKLIPLALSTAAVWAVPASAQFIGAAGLPAFPAPFAASAPALNLSLSPLTLQAPYALPAGRLASALEGRPGDISPNAFMSAVSPVPADFKTYDEAINAFHDARDRHRYDQAVEAGEAAVRLASPADREIAETMLAQTVVLLAAQRAEERRDFKEAIRQYAFFAERWPEQAGMAIDLKFVLERFEELLPESDGPLPSGVESARRVISLLQAGATTGRRTPQDEAAILEFRRLMRPLMKVDLDPLEDPRPVDVARLRDFAGGLIEAGQARAFGNLTARFSSTDPAPRNGQPNSLLAFGLIKFADRPTQDAFGIHDSRE